MIGSRPSALLFVLGGIAVHRNGVEAASPMEVLSNALNELTRVVSVPLSAVTAWSLMEDDPDFEEESESLEPREGQAACAGKSTEDTVSAVLQAAAIQAREGLQALSDVASSLYDSVEWTKRDTDQAALEETRKAEPAEKTEQKESPTKERADPKDDAIESSQEPQGSIEGYGSQIHDAVSGGSEKIVAESSNVEEKVQDTVKTAGDNLGNLVSEAEEGVQQKEKSDEMKQEAGLIVDDVKVRIAVLLWDAREKIEAARESAEPTRAIEDTIQDVKAQAGGIFSEARVKLEAARDSAEQKKAAEKILKATESEVAKILSEAKKELDVSREKSTESTLKAEESVRNAQAEVENLVSGVEEREATEVLGMDNYKEAEKAMEGAVAEIEKAFLEVKEH